MKELFGLKSFQQILFLIFFLGLTLGVLVGIYLFNPENFEYYLIIPSFPAFYKIATGLYRNVTLFRVDLKCMTKSNFSNI